jgi:hypothetical protein
VCYTFPSGISGREQASHAESDPSKEAGNTADDGEHGVGVAHVGWVYIAQSISQEGKGCAHQGTTDDRHEPEPSSPIPSLRFPAVLVAVTKRPAIRTTSTKPMGKNKSTPGGGMANRGATIETSTN